MPNEIIISGRLLDNFSLRFTKEGQPWGFFRIASQEGKIETSGRLSSLTFSEQTKRVDNMELEETPPF